MDQINTFFVRVASSCNLDCDYCYVFKKNDTSWKHLPPIMGIDVIKKFSERLCQYLLSYGLKKVNIVFHGGEPLIIGEDKFIQYSDILFDATKGIAEMTQSLQTNGTLINESLLEKCESRKICFSVSLDGGKTVHDTHRKNKLGNGSFDAVVSGINKLKNHPSIFSGIIGVINPLMPPAELLAFYLENRITNIDLLLPDSNYDEPPLYKDEANKRIYTEWLISAFDEWFDNFQEIRFRTFEVLLNNIIGYEASSDTFGLGYLDYLTIESDGSYHTSDILKSTFYNASSLGINVYDSSIADALAHENTAQYNTLLSFESLPQKCKTCEIVNLCGGGSLPHRYSHINGFNNPSIYCNDLKELITHIKERLTYEIEKEFKNE